MDENRSAARTNDRNSLIAFVLGLVFLLGGLAAGMYSTGSGVKLSGLIMLAGLVLIVLGIVFRGRRR